MYRTLSIAALMLCAWGPASAADGRIELSNGVFIVTGIADSREPPGGWIAVFSVSTGAENTPSMLGSYTMEAGRLLFKPRFPLAPGVRYHAVYRPTSGAEVEAWFDTPARALPQPSRVDRVYPSGDVWPSNELRFYIHFSAPMRRGGVWRHIHLLDDAGKIVPLAFLEIDQELWDSSNQRLTVLFDPGRIKRGIAPEREIGAPLIEGHSYTLLVEAELSDASGRPLAEEFRKTFRTGPPERSALDSREWRVNAPPAGSARPLGIDFPRPLDHALLEHALTISAASNPSISIPGTITIDHEETHWRFTPDHIWAAGDYELVISPELEDLAGNRFGRAFEIDATRPAPRADPDQRRLRFRVR